MKALVGHTGFVGGNLARQAEFQDFYHSKNIEDLCGKSYDLLAVSGAPAAKWLANREPEKDLRNLERLMACLECARAGKVVLISTIDVYPDPAGVDEDSPIDPELNHAYGKNRFALENFVRSHFPGSLVVRLPGLFGPGLRKNAIYDFLHDNEIHKIDSASQFQFYDLTRLWKDLSLALNSGLELLNVATEPVTVAEVVRCAFGRTFENRFLDRPPRYDFKSKHAALFGGRGGYLYDRESVLSALSAFVRQEKGSDS